MIQRILLIMILLGFFAGQAALAQTDPQKVSDKVSQAIGVEGNAQETADEWTWEKKDLLDEIRDLKYRITWLQYRQEKNRIYIKGVKENIANLEFAKVEINKLRERLEPYLEDVVARMEAFIESDLPFLLDERHLRLQILKDSLNNYNVPLSEKLRRVFAEGLQVETEYGKMVETIEDQTLTINGNETEVIIFRLGRVLMVYMTLDGTQIGRWNHESKQWEPLPESLSRSIRRALDIGQRRRTAEIVELPLGVVK